MYFFPLTRCGSMSRSIFGLWNISVSKALRNISYTNQVCVRTWSWREQWDDNKNEIFAKGDRCNDIDISSIIIIWFSTHLQKGNADLHSFCQIDNELSSFRGATESIILVTCFRTLLKIYFQEDINLRLEVPLDFGWALGFSKLYNWLSSIANQ